MHANNTVLTLTHVDIHMAVDKAASMVRCQQLVERCHAVDALNGINRILPLH
jgi:hypothetical protein